MTYVQVATTPLDGGMGVFAAMATPAVLLLANAMLILSTIQRLQAILARVSENEATIADGEREGEGREAAKGAVRIELELHGRRVRIAHRALFAFYASAAVFLVMIGALGGAAVGISPGAEVALLAAFVGAALLLLGTGLLIAETWAGVQATDRRVGRVLAMCERPRSTDGEITDDYEPNGRSGR